MWHLEYDGEAGSVELGNFLERVTKQLERRRMKNKIRKEGGRERMPGKMNEE